MKKALQRVVLLLPLVLIAVFLQAQYEEPVIDSTIEAIDDYNNQEEDPPAEAHYFLFKNMPGAGMDSLHVRHLPDSLLGTLKKDADFWYANKVFKNKSNQNAGDSEGTATYKRSDPISRQPWFQTFLWLIIIGGFTAFVIMYLANSNTGLFRKSNKTVGEAAEESATDDIFAINYQKEIDKATATGNYRLAIRLMFLRLLKNLSQKNIIQYKHDRTNLDYLMQLSSTKYYKDFFRITRNYEYSWYGKFEVSPDAYKLIKTDFDNFDPSIK